MSGVDLLIKRGIADPAKWLHPDGHTADMTTWLLGNYLIAGAREKPVRSGPHRQYVSDIHAPVETYYEGSPFKDRSSRPIVIRRP
jgi:hypothetical protein